MKRKIWLIWISLGSLASMAIFFACASETAKVKAMNLDASATLGAHLMGLTQAVAQQKDSQPLVFNGDCGGKVTVTMNQSNQGSTTVSTGTASFDNFCSTDQTTKNTTTITGDNVPFTFTTVPNASGTGTSTSNLTANAPVLNIVKKDPSGNTLQSTAVGLTNLVYTAGIPGQPATTDHPNVTTIDQLNVNVNTNQSLMLQNVTLKQVPQTGGGSTVNATGRAFWGPDGYVDFTALLHLDANSAPTHNDQIIVTGANNSTATFTVVTGAPVVVSATATGSNGTPLTAQLSCTNVKVPTVPTAQ